MAFLDELFAALWAGHAATTPAAARLDQLLRARGEPVRSDHVALVTFDLPRVEIESVDRAFVAHGYEAAESYELPDRGLIASHYEHGRDLRLPKVVIAAVVVDELSTGARDLVRRLVAGLPAGAEAHPLFAASGRPWALSSAEHRGLREESPDAAWAAAFGLRAHHAAIDAGALRGFDGLEPLHRLLEAEGFRIDRARGEIRASLDARLEQSFLLADEVDVPMTDGAARLASGRAALARRQPDAAGELFQGFVAEHLLPPLG